MKTVPENVSNIWCMSDTYYLFGNKVCVLFMFAVLADRLDMHRLWERHVMINRILVGGSQVRRPLVRRRRRWEDVKLYLQEMGWEGVEWIDLAEDGDKWRALVCGHGSEPSGCINVLNFLRGAFGVSNRTPKVVTVHRMAVLLVRIVMPAELLDPPYIWL